MRFKLKKLVLAGLLAGLGASAFAATYHFVQPMSAGGASGASPFTLPLTVALTAWTIPDAVVGVAYAGTGFDFGGQLQVTGDASFNAALATFSVTSGTLPAGLTLSPAGKLTGIPTTAGAAQSVQITASYKSVTGAQQYQLIALNIAVSLTAETLTAATKNSVYTKNFASNLTVAGDGGAVAQPTFTLASGTLPAGLALSTAGVLSGTPTATTVPAGASFTVQATYKTKTGQQAYTIIVNGVPLQVTSISSGAIYTCAVTTSGGAKCWGNNMDGHLGDGTTVEKSTPVDVSGLTSGVISISAGDGHTCAVTTSGAKCWGFNGSGQLGDGTTVTRLTPVPVSGLTSGVASIHSGYSHTCAVTTSGGAKCWGWNGYGQLGDGTTVSRLTPVDVSGLTSGVTSISSGGLHTCAVTTSGGAKCWGRNAWGQLGDGTTAGKLMPVDVSGLTSGVASISSDYLNTCAVTTSGGAKCWGWNGYGQLGDGTKVDKSTPVDVSVLTSGVASINAGYVQTCAVTTSGGVKCWGSNYNGQLGDGTTVDKLTPVDVSGLTSGVASISGGAGHTCAVTTSGGAKCWGRNDYGQLGDCTTVDKLMPVDVLAP